MKQLDACTFGPYKASENLAEILNELGDDKISKKIARLYVGYTTEVKHCKLLPNAMQRKILRMLWKYYMDTLDDLRIFHNLPKNLVTFTENVISAVYKSNLNKIK